MPLCVRLVIPMSHYRVVFVVGKETDGNKHGVMFFTLGHRHTLECKMVKIVTPLYFLFILFVNVSVM